MTKTDVHNDSLERLMSVFSFGSRQNIALVGPDGSGMNTKVVAFAEMPIDGRADAPVSNIIPCLDGAQLFSEEDAR